MAAPTRPASGYGTPSQVSEVTASPSWLSPRTRTLLATWKRHVARSQFSARPTMPRSSSGAGGALLRGNPTLATSRTSTPKRSSRVIATVACALPRTASLPEHHEQVEARGGRIELTFDGDCFAEYPRADALK